jgi:hypothetical protein
VKAADFLESLGWDRRHLSGRRAEDCDWTCAACVAFLKPTRRDRSDIPPPSSTCIRAGRKRAREDRDVPSASRPSDFGRWRDRDLHVGGTINAALQSLWSAVRSRGRYMPTVPRRDLGPVSLRTARAGCTTLRTPLSSPAPLRAHRSLMST